ncbi:hypothetical protein JXI42_08710 [bacterium]|nr:hypothetical protein [bacterium]
MKNLNLTNYLVLIVLIIFGISISLVEGKEEVKHTSLNLTVNDYGISFGNSARLNGLRFNIRDKDVERINGINITFWFPVDSSGGAINGAGIGLLRPGGERLNGVFIGGLGVGAEENISGIALGTLGVGAGYSVSGIAVGGLGVGAGGHLKGIAIGGLGVGAGQTVTGITIGGFGVGAGNHLNGLAIGLLGVGAGQNVSGITIGGLGVGAGENLNGLAIGLLGVGAGKNVSGVSLGGFGVGAGEKISGLALSPLAVGAGKSVDGIAVAGLGIGCGNKIKGIAFGGCCVYGNHIRGLTASAVIVTTVFPGNDHWNDQMGSLKGVSIAGINYIRGEQRGLTIGLFNYANELKGMQFGVINYAGNNPLLLKLLPVVNVHL